MVHSSPRRTSHKPVAGTCVHTHLTTTCVCASNMAVVGAIIEYRDCATHDLFTPEGHKMVKRCTIALLDKRLPHGLCRQFRSQDGRLQALRSLVDASFSLQGEAQVHYPNLHENLENNISPIKCITNKLLSLNKARI